MGDRDTVPLSWDTSQPYGSALLRCGGGEDLEAPRRHAVTCSARSPRHRSFQPLASTCLLQAYLKFPFRQSAVSLASLPQVGLKEREVPSLLICFPALSDTRSAQQPTALPKEQNTSAALAPL